MRQIGARFAALAVLAAGCTAKEQSEPPPSQGSVPAEVTDIARKPLDGDVRIALKVTESTGQLVRITGTTNLPTETRLMFSVEERVQDGFYGRSEGLVLADGSFQSELFGPSHGLQDGVYIASVTMPIPRVQPDHVRQLIGANGEHLSGPLVEAGDLGVSVSVNQAFTIGGGQASRLQGEREAARVRQYREWLNKIVALNQRLVTARSNWLVDKNNSAGLASWGKFARQFNNEHGRLVSELAEMPISERLTLGDPLEYVRQMFHTTAFDQAQEYHVASTQYTESLKELKTFVAEAERSQ